MRMIVGRGVRRFAVLSFATAGLAVWSAGAVPAASSLPEIRISSHNRVPACVTPERLMTFLRTRNDRLLPQFRDIARHYKRHGEAWNVRWDYAFFQMAIETNFLTYRAPNGRMGDVDPRQNNFAGIGTTGGGVPGDSFPDVSTGVLGQIQHLVVYSGETVANPVAERTRLKQEHILAHSLKLNRAVRFSDLAGRWAVDRKYAGSIEWVASRFRADYCKGRQAAPPPQEVEILPWQQPPAPARAVGRGKRAAAPPSPAGKADTVNPDRAVRTVWSRDDKSRGADAPAPRQSGAPFATASVTPLVTKTIPVQTAPVVPRPVPGADSEGDARGPADGGARFALFTPPAGLARVQMPAATTFPPSSVPTAGTVGADRAAARQRPDGATMGPSAPPGLPADVAVGAPAEVAAAQGPGTAAKPAFLPPSGLGVKPGRCVVETATFGGETTVLVKTPMGADVHYVALSVLDGFEDSMTKSFLAARPAGGEALGTYPTKDAALAQARTLCPE